MRNNIFNVKPFQKVSVLVFFLFIFGHIYAQDGLKSNVFLRAGVLQTSVGYEYILSKQFSLSSEAGLAYGYINSGIIGSSFVSLTPKYYYNINKRQKKGRNTQNNAANYFGIDLSYVPDIFTFSNTDNINVIRSLSITPVYGMRRNIVGGLNFDFRFGLLGVSFFESNMPARATYSIFVGLSYVF